MRRRDFLILSGMSAMWLAFNSGCSRLLDWSASLHKPAVKTVKKAAPEPQAETAGFPDLAVVSGGEPAENLAAVLKELGGMERFVKPGARVVLKPNLLTGREPQFATTTNPDLVGAVVKACFAAGAASVVVLDRSTSDQSQAFEISGITAAVTAAGGEIKILTDRNYENTAIPAGKVLTEWPLVKDVFEADVFINLPIAKTHGSAILTMAMKNLMGIMGGERGTIHIDMDQKLVDINTLVKPHLVILDAYRILVRNGPTGGDLADVETPKTLIAGANAVSIDAYGTSLFGMKPADIPYIVRAGEQGLGIVDMSKLKIATVKTGDKG